MLKKIICISIWVMHIPAAGIQAQDFFNQSAVCDFAGSLSAMISADMNKDGKKDLILAGEAENGKNGLVSVFLNQGDGTFVRSQDITVDMKPIVIRAGDFDNDGWLDLITANSTAKTVSLILAQSDGTFKIKETEKFKEMPLSIGIGDFNKDKHLDFAVTLPSSKELQIFRGNGKGSFKQAASRTFDAVPLYIRAGDYANIGQTHIILTHENQTALTLVLLEEISSNKWDIKTSTLDFLTRPNFAELGDIDGDGIEDATILDDVKKSLRVVFGESNGLFLDKVFPIELPTSPNAFIMDDFNADYRIDLVILDQPGRRAILFSNILTTAETVKAPAGMRITIICDTDDNKPNTADVGILSAYPNISMLLYNGEGELVRKYFEFDSDLPEGQFTFEWSGTDEDENPVPDGSYIFYLKLGGITMSRMVTK